MRSADGAGNASKTARETAVPSSQYPGATSNAVRAGSEIEWVESMFSSIRLSIEFWGHMRQGIARFSSRRECVDSVGVCRFGAHIPLPSGFCSSCFAIF